MADYLDYNGLQLYDTLLKSDANPAALGTASAGSSKKVSRADHVHPMPDSQDLDYVSGTNESVDDALARLDLVTGGFVTDISDLNDAVDDLVTTLGSPVIDQFGWEVVKTGDGWTSDIVYGDSLTISLGGALSGSINMPNHEFTASMSGMPILYGLCSTAAATAEKVVTLYNLTTQTSDSTAALNPLLVVLFTNANTASSPTLNVPMANANTLPIYKPSSSNWWEAGSAVLFVYDASNSRYVMLGTSSVVDLSKATGTLGVNHGGTGVNTLGQGLVYHSASGTGALSIASAANIVSALGTTPVNRATADANGDNIATTYAKLSDIPASATDFTGATSSAAGAHGLVPAPAAGDQSDVLFGNASWDKLVLATEYEEPDMHGADSNPEWINIHLYKGSTSGTLLSSIEMSEATASHSGLMPRDMFSKLNALPDNATLQSTYLTQSSAASTYLTQSSAASTYALKTDITGAYKYKGSVTDASGLPASPATGDVYNLVNETVYGPAGTNVAWTGSAWDALGGLFTISSITTAQINALFA